MTIDTSFSSTSSYFEGWGFSTTISFFSAALDLDYYDFFLAATFTTSLFEVAYLSG